ncbi:PFL_4695 family integrating conjugative element protein [Pseudomonas aeruginosa]|uniref:PFL_4695 family integrating conjugative element protein n=1 Tax=Pseudomonas aeruginosa TaxID=287 RepID=UPI002271E6C0|nr:integrating conjugative element protein [Pseudomonas aeruginosa]MCY0305938.1 integrating conjugative element protein [Pseudomonas aeruginosa]
MTKPHPVQLALTGLLMLLSGLPLASRAGEPLIVVEDRGGTSALPYYEALNLQPRAAALRERGAVGLVVNVETAQSLARLRALVPGVPLAPVAGDDLADRLGLRHYPALITATGIEQ